MGIQQLLFAGVVALGIFGYWWWTFGRHGANAANVHIGLEPGDVRQHSFSGSFHLDRGVKDVALAAVAVGRVGAPFWLTRTEAGVTVLKPQGDDAMRFAAGDFQLELFKENVDRLPGASGAMEAADVYEVKSSTVGEPLRVKLARSGAETLNQSAKSSAA